MFSLAARVLAGCVGHQASIDEDDEDILRPSCMVLPASGDFEDGSLRVLVSEWDTVGTVCMCMTIEDLEWMNYHGLTCGDEDLETGCSIPTREAPRTPWALLLVVSLAAGRRLRRAPH